MNGYIEFAGGDMPWNYLPVERWTGVAEREFDQDTCSMNTPKNESSEGLSEELQKQLELLKRQARIAADSRFESTAPVVVNNTKGRAVSGMVEDKKRSDFFDSIAQKIRSAAIVFTGFFNLNAAPVTALSGSINGGDGESSSENG